MTHTEPIAIVGIGCRFPGANGPEEFWRLLTGGVDAITEVPANRFDINAFYDRTPGVPGKISSRFGGFISNVECFDEGFFGISPREAEAMDPQQRILMEVAHEALEDAGTPADQPGMTGTGVFLGVMADDYLRHTYRSHDIDLTIATGGSRGTAAARISYALGFQGPSIVVDSDRASSLTALHLACQSLRSGECSVALVGACNLILSPELSIACSRSGILSSDGRCKFGDARADGIARSEGCGVLVLKNLSQAIADNDRIYAVVKGSAVSNNGNSSMELMRPSVHAQEALLRTALKDADVSPADVLYVEAHGTGTPVGDRVEAEALGTVLGAGRATDKPCLIGSVKTNIGHAEAAGGIAGIIKVALALRNGILPRSLHFEHENPELHLEERRLRVQAEASAWPANDGKPAVAGVSAFGLTGTIAHVVLQAAPHATAGKTTAAVTAPYILPISARSSASLDSLVEAYRDLLTESEASASLADICHSAATRRQHHSHRAALVASSPEEMREQLNAYLKGERFSGAHGLAAPQKHGKIAFIFPGQGGQAIGMGRELLESEPVFREVVQLCDEAVRAEAGWSVQALLQGELPDSLLEEIDYLQPTLTTVMVALAALWRSWGIEPDATLGLSMGEAAAAHVAGMLDIRDTMVVVCRRARLLKRLRGKGAILSTPLSYADAQQALIPYRPQLSIAVVASPTNTVLSGDLAAMKTLAAELESRGFACRFVKSDVAGHSTQMDPLLDELRTELADLQPRKGSMALASTVDDAYLTGSELNADYWARNLRQTVLQMNGIERFLQDGYTTFLEVSPHPVAWNPIWETIHHLHTDAAAVGSLRHEEGEREALLKAVATLYAQGVSPNWNAIFHAEGSHAEDRRAVSLPTYRWEHKSWWLNTAQSDHSATAKTPISTASVPANAAIRTRVLDQLKSQPSGQRRKFLLDHLQGMVAKILRLADPAAANITAPLRQLGLTSLMATELAMEVELAYQHPCSATLVFNYPNIEKIADHLLAEGVAESLPESNNSEPQQGESVAVEAPSEVHYAQSQQGVNASNINKPEPIAIIGLGCRFPGAATPEDYWHILRGGVDVISEVPPDRWNITDFYDSNPEAPGKMYSRWGGFLESIDHFDAAYFGISPREAAALDPQQRLLLEVTVQALEHAGQAPDPQNASNCGVFVGIMNNNDFVSVKGLSADHTRVNAHDSTGHATSAAAGRLSYALGFQGPSMAIDTACSSSLVAIHLACQSLRSHECEMAVAGGVNVIIAPEVTISFCKTRMLSPTGRCKTFDSRADGYVRGEGCGMIVLKRLSDAVRDNDNVLAVIRGTAVNQDGRSSSLTAPNGLAQQALVRQALHIAGIRPDEVDYIEAHGTGTALGDPIEIEALGKVLSEGRDSQRPFLVGSVKTNIGHLESAAGVAGLIKVILSLQNQEIPPHLHLQEVNPRISLAASNASIPTRLTPWARNGRRRIAGISSFGFVGTNAHLVVEEAPLTASSKQSGARPVHRLLALSARSREGLKDLAGRYSRVLSRRTVDSAMDIDDLCYTANTGRIHHEVRTAITASGTEALKDKLAKLREQPLQPTASASQPGKIAFLFTGQGSQYQFMGRNLFSSEPVFREALERCARIIDPLLQTSLLSVINDENAERLYQTQFAQPALFALEYAVLEQWRSWGIEPAMVMGHSLGEYTAAVAAQVLTLEQAAKLVVTRGRLMQSIQAAGGSAAVFASEEFARPFVEPYSHSVAIAADNAPERVLIAGEQKDLQTICDALTAQGIEVRTMIGLIGPHCPLMDPILDTFETIAAMTTYNAPSIPMVSTGTARVMAPEDVSDPKHWRDLIRNKVRFREGMQVLYDAGCRIFVEIGPRHTLIRLGEMCLPLSDLTWLSSLSKEKHDQEQMLESLGRLYSLGVQVDWENFHQPFAARKISLPATVFEGRSFWPERSQQSSSSSNQSRASKGSHDALTQLLGQRLRSPLMDIQFESRVNLNEMPWLEDHRILDSLVMPGAGQIVRVLAAIEQVTGQHDLELSDALFPEPLVLGDSEDARIAQLVLSPQDDGYNFKISSTSQSDEGDSAWRLHVTGHVGVQSGNAKSNPEGAAPVSVVTKAFTKDSSAIEISGEDFYAIQAENGYVLGPSFRWLEQVSLGRNEATTTLRRPQVLVDTVWSGLHPGLIDSCIQVASRVANNTPGPKDTGVLVPAAISGFKLFGNHIERAQQTLLRCVVSRLTPVESTVNGNGLGEHSQQNKDAVTLSLTVSDQSGNVLFFIDQLHLRRLSSRDLVRSASADFDEAFRRIVWSDSDLPVASSIASARWLIFADEGGLAATLADRLREQGQDAVMVFKTQEHIKNGHSLRMNPENQSEFSKQLAQMQNDAGATWQGIVYMWGLDEISQERNIILNDPGEDKTGDRHGLLNLAKAMINTPNCPPLWIVTRASQRTQRESKLNAITQSMLWGLGRVFASEHPALLGGLIDLDPHALIADDASQLLDELWAQDSDTQVAYRAGKRLVPRLKHLGRGRSRSRFRARNDASYLITGAFGALGRKVAEWLVANGARHLALVSRRPPDDEASLWLKGLEKQGVKCLSFQADVSAMAEVAACLAELDRSMPALRGVIHAAGIIEDNVFSNVEWSGFARVQAPKALGSWNLHTLTADRPLDFWVIFSSVTALLGNPGQAAYVAGNSYADALVQHRRMQGAPALSINWGPWKGDGMSAHVADDLHRRWGLIAIDPAEGVEMLGQLLNTGGGQIWAAPVDVEILKQRFQEYPHLALISEMVGVSATRTSSSKTKASANGTGRLQDLPDDQRRVAVMEHVVDLVRSVTGMDASEPVRVDARLETLGVDSLLTLDLINALSRFFGVNLPTTIFITCPTIELLVNYLCEQTALTAAAPAALVS